MHAMKDKDDQWSLPIFYVFAPELSKQLAYNLNGWSAKLGSVDGKAQNKRYAVHSRGLSDLRHLLCWAVRVAPTDLRARLALLLVSALAAVVLLASLLRGNQGLLRSLPFGESLVFNASVGGSWQKTGLVEQQRPKLIPRVVHQTYSSLEAIPFDLAAIRESWSRLNPGWQIRFWDDALCREFVRREFPEYHAAYVGLPKNVERADFFRYLVVLRHGGVYADIDTECTQPLDSLIGSSDLMVVGWEGEVGDDQALVNRHFARHRQVRPLRVQCEHLVRDGPHPPELCGAGSIHALSCLFVSARHCGI